MGNFISNVKDVSSYLIESLLARSFKVSGSDEWGAIDHVSKFGVKCVPELSHESLGDGQSADYKGYLSLATSTAAGGPLELGFYEVTSLDKYSVSKPATFDMSNYKSVIARFVYDLNVDYIAVVKPGLDEFIESRRNERKKKYPAVIKNEDIKHVGNTLTIEEVKTVNAYLAMALRRKRFDVTVNEKLGYISSVSKFGVHCLPGISHTGNDSKYDFSFLTLGAGRSDPADLGYYSSARGSVLYEYAPDKRVRIDMRNYEALIDIFVHELNVDYIAIVKPSLKEGIIKKVKIKGTGDVFDGKEGIVEEEGDEFTTVFVNFDDKGHKVRQKFKTENVEFREEQVLMEDKDEFDDIEVSGEPAELGTIEVPEENVLLLADNFGIEPEKAAQRIHRVSEDDNTKYKIQDGGGDFNGVYLVLDYGEAYRRAHDDLAERFENEGIWAFEIEYSDFLDYDSPFFENTYENYILTQISDLSDEELYMRAISYGVLSEDDFEHNGGGTLDLSSPKKDEINRDNITQKLVKASKEELAETDSYVSWFLDTFSYDDVRAMIENRPDIVDIEEVIDFILNSEGFGVSLATYDGREYYLGGNSQRKTMFAFRIE